MKPQKILHQTVKFTPPQILLLIFLMCNTVAQFCGAQDYSMLYYHDPARQFIYTDAVVTEKFYPSNAFSFDGTIIFQPLEDNSDNRLQVTLTDNSGAVVNTRTYELPGNEDMIPNAAAYNSDSKLYIVSGVCRSFSNFNIKSSWYMLLDQDLNFIACKQFAIQSAFPFSTPPPSAGDQSTFVTDVCPVLFENGVDFAFTGVVLNNSSDPDIGVANPADRMVFIAKLDASTVQISDWREYYISINAMNATRYTYPSRITEIGSANNSYPGYVIGGTTMLTIGGSGAPAFYMRTDNALTTVELRHIEDNSPGLNYGVFAVGDLFYDNNVQEVYIAGTITFDNTTNEGLYFFDKLDNVTAGINTDSYISTWGNAVGAFRLPLQDLNGYPKVGRISNAGTQNYSVITAVIYENFPGPWATTLKIPHVMRVDYADAALASWTGAGQNSQIDLYPRQIYGNIPLAYYNAHNYSSPWYPNHTSQQHYETSDMYALAGLSDDPASNPGDYLCMNMTHLISDNTCNQFQQNATKELISVLPNPIFPSVVQNLIDEVVVNLAFPNWATPTSNDCISQLSFRENKVTSINPGYWFHEGKLFRQISFEEETGFTVFSADGRKIQAGLWPMGSSSIEFNDLPVGLHFVQVHHLGKSHVIKVINY